MFEASVGGAGEVRLEDGSFAAADTGRSRFAVLGGFGTGLDIATVYGVSYRVNQNPDGKDMTSMYTRILVRDE